MTSKPASVSVASVAACARNVLVAEVMSPDLKAVHRDMSVLELTRYLIEQEISGALVEDDTGDLVGVVSLSDIAISEGTRVEHIMNPAVYSVAVEDTVQEVARQMVDSRVHRALVTDDARPVGIVTSRDLLALLAGVST